MSNFICSECGMTNIDCDGAGYKTPKEIELEDKISKAISLIKDVRFVECLELLEGNK